MKLKICGMKFENNISEINNLNPDFMGFIFWPNSKRFFNEKSIRISNKINKVGVFVNQDYDFIIDKIKTQTRIELSDEAIYSRASKADMLKG